MTKYSENELKINTRIEADIAKLVAENTILNYVILNTQREQQSDSENFFHISFFVQ